MRSSSSSSLLRLLLALCIVCAFLPSVAEAENECKVLDENGDDVTAEHYDASTQKVTCTGDRACYGYVIDHCHSILCEGMEACNQANITRITGPVQCLDTHACHHTNIHAVPGSEDANAACNGSGACDVTSMTNMNRVICNGSKGCRKARIHANMVQCSKGGTRYKACSASAAIIFKDCLYCGRQGCENVYNMCRYRNSDEIVNENYWDTHWMGDEWTPCPLNEILGECNPEWTTQFEDEQLEEEAKQDSEEDGS